MLCQCHHTDVSQLIVPTDVCEAGTVLCKCHHTDVSQLLATTKDHDGHVWTVLCHHARVRQLLTLAEVDVYQMRTVFCQCHHNRVQLLTAEGEFDACQAWAVRCQCHHARDRNKGVRIRPRLESQSHHMWHPLDDLAEHPCPRFITRM